ncbi:histidinol-phosphate transaminase [Paenibacillus sp. sptzw28]|uniref:pyridoxal phosphate-dependent aminotransferase n=1 Tax=Paenibacillus sp. sptzw28 TaxID=715179 RepID=UPI002163ED8B|nr:threonine-phosphate decarboxylase [Paenibacillus sp. sptzw28]
MLERFGHGGDLLTAQELFGIEAGRFADFSANMNPFGPPACVAQLLVSYAGTIGRYPDPAVRGLRRSLALHHEVDESCILIGNGAAELIDLTLRALKPAVTVLAVPCFAEYGDAARKCGSKVRTISLLPEERFHLPLERVTEMLGSLRNEGLVEGEALWFFGSPGNPTGALIDPDAVRLLLKEGERVAVDEAFMDFVPEAGKFSLLTEAANHERLYVLRSMTKFYAIPGIRLGYMCASPGSIAALKELQVPWSVNSLAQQIGEAVLDEGEYRGKTLSWLAEERPWLARQLSSLGLAVFEGAANYILFSIPEESGWTSQSLQRSLGQRGILIRDASLFDGLDGTFCRIAVRFREEHLRLLHELQALFSDKGKEASGRRES